MRGCPVPHRRRPSSGIADRTRAVGSVDYPVVFDVSASRSASLRPALITWLLVPDA
ncbi:MAG: hypothetical protein AVDCRST_MAG21-536 [uncultured Nocardioidaceae bacterium]|uniref:Uncharacterized protein n=1 Tax=uncultured Nocardioidaceae bacterium TaxID=253824 RepID=A0A6J4MUJ2_9ACTN|nr:MAG: hypothetical protein AVDCRST_MAG21-536 [uncultured Nocardioidaceae bacterium]